MSDENYKFSTHPDAIKSREKRQAKLCGRDKLHAKQNRLGRFDSEKQSLLTPKVAQALFKCARAGMFDKDAAIKCGIGKSTLWAWLKKGVQPGAEEPHKSFAIKYLQLQLELQLKLKKTIHEAAFGAKKVKSRERKDWKASAYELEKRWPGLYGNLVTAASFAGAVFEIEEKQSNGERAKAAFRNPSPELHELVRSAGYKLIPLENESEQAEPLLPLGNKEE